jgi:catechol 2,3-dioxygenase-like lactoylglutathione lyase family enzyme
MSGITDTPRRFSVRLRFVTVRTSDLVRARAFYQGLLGLPSTREEPGEFVQLWAGGVDLCVDIARGAEEPLLIFTVDNIAALSEELRRASMAAEGPRQGRERQYLLVHDPDGNLLVFEEER